MKKLWVIPTLCLICAACGDGGYTGPDRVQSRQNDQAVAPMTPDWELTVKVKAELMADTSLPASARLISVSTTDGVVTLTGSVASRADRYSIVRAVQNVKGVAKVKIRSPLPLKCGLADTG